jgi:hypothetical protein
MRCNYMYLSLEAPAVGGVMAAASVVAAASVQSGKHFVVYSQRGSPLQPPGVAYRWIDGSVASQR